MQAESKEIRIDTANLCTYLILTACRCNALLFCMLRLTGANEPTVHLRHVVA